VGEILQLLQTVDGAEIELEWGDLKIQVRRGAAGSRAQAATLPAQNDADHAGESTTEAVERTAGMSVPVTGDADTPRPASPAGLAGDPQPDIPPHWVAVNAPMVGTFYRSPTPNDPPFAEVGDTVSEGQTVALIEVMKLFTELKAEVSGKIARVDVPDSTLVEYGQALVWIEPA
jgi:acetyl-CoA carboxylase biotin carboxyl carrier protein